MEIKEFGTQNERVVVLVHPSLMTWDYFEYVIPLLENDYHLVIPVVPGYNLNDSSDFTSVEQIAAGLASWLVGHNNKHAHAAYGCPMGGSIVLKMAVDNKVQVDHIVMDGGITPYQLPWILTRFIALRDFSMVAMGKLGGEKLLVKAFSSTEFSDEDLAYLARVLKHCSYKTIWNTFDSCNNYRMPKEPVALEGAVHYWYAEKERKERDWDLKFMRKFVPQTVFREFANMDHGDMALFQPERFAEEIRALD